MAHMLFSIGQARSAHQCNHEERDKCQAMTKTSFMSISFYAHFPSNGLDAPGAVRHKTFECMMRPSFVSRLR
jgi:hypothetical protein